MPGNKDGKLGIIIGIGRPKSGAPKPPFDDPRAPQGAGGKADRGSAGYIPAEASCGNCSNWDQPTGQCAQVEGEFRPNDRCEQYFTPANPNYMHITPTPAHTEDQESHGNAQDMSMAGGPTSQGDGASQPYGQ